MSQIQYQPCVAPLFTGGGQAPETITSDKWTPRTPDPVRRPWAVALFVAACVLPSTFAEGAINPPTDWRPRHPDKTYSRPRTADIPAWVAPLQVPDVTQPVPVLSWLARYPDRLRAKPRAVEFPALATPWFVADVTQPAPALAWRPTFPDRASRCTLHVSQQPTFTWHILHTEPPQAPAITPPVYADRLWRTPPTLNRTGYATPVYVPDATDPAPASSWAPAYPSWIARRALLTAEQQTRADAPLHVPDVTHVVPRLGWTARYPDRVWAKARAVAFPQPAAPVFVSDVTVVAPSHAGWKPSYPDRLHRKRSVWAPPAWTSHTAPVPAPTIDPTEIPYTGGVVRMSVAAGGIVGRAAAGGAIRPSAAAGGTRHTTVPGGGVTGKVAAGGTRRTAIPGGGTIHDDVSGGGIY
jgi:hypothetical protein